MFESPRRGRQARNFTTNVPKILDLKSSSEQIFPKIDVGCPWLVQPRRWLFQDIRDLLLAPYTLLCTERTENGGREG